MNLAILILLVLGSPLGDDAPPSVSSDSPEMCRPSPSSDYAEAFAAAQSDGRPLVVFATSPGCIPCEEMKRDTIGPMIAAGELSNTHFVTINTAEDPGLAASLEISRTPTLVVFHSGERRVRRAMVGKVAAGVVRTALAIPAAVRAAATPRDVSTYRARWTNYDGLSREDHARVMHGLNTAGMSADAIARRLDADHDRYGPGHPMAAASGGCPGGSCPTGSRSRGVFRARWRR
jgi:thiol-disulfide isomerase/thioredoxin